MAAMPHHKALLLAARELLIDLERTDFDDIVPTGASGISASVPAFASTATAPGVRSVGKSADPKHKEVLLQQVDLLREQLIAEQQAREQLSCENAQLANDLRSLASQLKQERAASNAVLTRQMAAGGDGEGSGGAEEQPGRGMDGSGGQSGGLTLASAASQILLLRREVKFLQKQWNSARVDQGSAMTREQMQELRDEAAEARRVAAAAEVAISSSAAKNRLLVRELRAARAQVKAQQARMLRRSGAQHEVVALKEQLGKAHDAYVAQQQQLKQLQLRERLRGRAADEQEDDALGGSSGDDQLSQLEAEAAHSGLGLLLLSNEMTLLERAWMAEKGAAAELVAIKANMSFQVAQVEDENTSLRAEVAKLTSRVAELQEEREMLQGSLNAMNNDLSQAPIEQQHTAALAAADAASAVAMPPPSAAKPPPKTAHAAANAANAAANKMAASVSKFKFGKKKAAAELAS